jgi:hypothetical protein
MSWTSGYTNPPASGSGGVQLPAPKVKTVAFDPAASWLIPDVTLINPPALATVSNQVVVSIDDMPQAIVDDPGTYQPRLELVRYRRGNHTQTANRVKKSSGYVHPVDPARWATSDRTRSGFQAHAAGPIDPAVIAIRTSEWAVTAQGQQIDVTQAMLGYMCRVNIRYRRQQEADTGNLQLLENVLAVVPASRLSGSRSAGRIRSYDARFYPGYFKFRYSIFDNSSGLWSAGPLSETVACTNHTFPFEERISPLNVAYAALNPAFVPSDVRFWVGPVSRLPTTPRSLG